MYKFLFNRSKLIFEGKHSDVTYNNEPMKSKFCSELVYLEYRRYESDELKKKVDI